MPEMWKAHFNKLNLLPKEIDSATKCLREQTLSQEKYIEASKKELAEHVSTKKHALSKLPIVFTLMNALRIHS
jgi:hypothetical protein